MKINKLKEILFENLRISMWRTLFSTSFYPG